MEPNNKNNPLADVNLANRDFQQPGTSVSAATNAGNKETDDADDDDLDDDDLDETDDEDIDGETTGDDAGEDEEND